MGEKTNTSIYVLLAGGVAILLWVLVAYLAIYLPPQGEMLMEMGSPLSGGMQLALSASAFMRAYALFLAPVFLIITGLPFYILMSGND